VTSLSRSSRILRKVNSSFTFCMLSAYVQVTHQNVWGTVNHETGIKDMKCALSILSPKLEHTILESPCHKLGVDYAVSMVDFISGDVTHPLLIRSNMVSKDGYVYSQTLVHELNSFLKVVHKPKCS